MVFYVAYRAPKAFKDRSRIPPRLRALGCTHVHRSFWEVKEEKADRVLRVLQKNQPILLKRTREIRKPHFMKEKDISELGSLIIITYKIPKEVKRQKIKNFLEKTPYIRLCRSVYAFSQNHSRFDKNKDLADARLFWEFIQEIDEDAKAIPRVVIVNSDSIERLLEETKRRVENEIDDIVWGYKGLYKKANSGESDKQSICSALSKLNKRFITVKKVAAFYEKWLKMGFSKSLMKPYPIIKKVRSMVNEKYGLL